MGFRLAILGQLGFPEVSHYVRHQLGIDYVICQNPEKRIRAT